MNPTIVWLAGLAALAFGLFLAVPFGVAVAVWYDPDKPSWSSLDNVPPTGGKYRLVTLVLLAVAAAGGVAAFVYS